MTLMEAYSEAAPRTASEAIHFDVANPGVLAAIIEERLAIAPDVDAVKKGLFYGRDKTGRLGYWGKHARVLPAADLQKLFDVRHALHGILGVDSEIAELIELFAAGELTREKVLDEAGDVLWYFNLLLRAFDLTFEQVATANLAKLAKRYPDGGFSLDQWEARDKVSEQREIDAQL